MSKITKEEARERRISLRRDFSDGLRGRAFPLFVRAVSSMAIIHGRTCTAMFLSPLPLWFSRVGVV
ncbi:MAG: hypothetical protein H5T50_03915 [Nitrososphaeria archaeon]|nr:hypothetical protein [Nitrososphaeria archaeon]